MKTNGKTQSGARRRRHAMIWAAAMCLAFPAAGLAEGPEEKPAGGGVYYEAPQNLCDELGGTPECPPDGAPIDPAKAQPTEEKPEVIYQAPAANPPAQNPEATPEAYRELESDCEKAGWGGAPTCD